MRIQLEVIEKQPDRYCVVKFESGEEVRNVYVPYPDVNRGDVFEVVLDRAGVFCEWSSKDHAN